MQSHSKNHPGPANTDHVTDHVAPNNARTFKVAYLR